MKTTAYVWVTVTALIVTGLAFLIGIRGTNLIVAFLASGLGALTTALYQHYDSKKKVILVWHKNQRIPATLYGDLHFGKGRYKIWVCKDPNKVLAKLDNERALIYHFH